MMSQSDGIWYICPACGASNPSTSIVCFLCGRSLDATREESVAESPATPISFSSPESPNPYAPPASDLSRRVTFPIGSLLMVIAVIALCLGVARANLVLGIVFAGAVVPAIIYSEIVAAKRKGSGISMTIRDRLVTFLIGIAGVYAVVTSAMVAFLTTCVPVAFVTEGSGAALLIGGMAAIAAAAFAIYLLLFRKSHARRLAGKP